MIAKAVLKTLVEHFPNTLKTLLCRKSVHYSCTGA